MASVKRGSETTSVKQRGFVIAEGTKDNRKMREPFSSPCENCGQMPAVIGDLCGGCWDRLIGQHEHYDDHDYDDYDDYDESDWYNERTREPM